MLVDSFHREHDYLRISVTERCNLRCGYCMPEDGITLNPKSAFLTDSEIVALAHIFVQLGIRKIRITGGEPLIRPNIEELCSNLALIPDLEELALSTNGLLLEKKLPALWNAGVKQLNISLDTLHPERFKDITERNTLDQVLSAIRAAVQFQSQGGGRGFDSIKVNAVVLRGINDDEILDLIQFGDRLQVLGELIHRMAPPPGIEIRFIEFMPFPGNAWDDRTCVTYREMREEIDRVYTLDELVKSSSARGPARRFRIRETGSTVGFITSMSDDFCGDCNRLRLTADGMFRTCLFGSSEINLRELLRTNASERTIESAIHAALALKWEKHPDAMELVQINTRDMIAIGG